MTAIRQHYDDIGVSKYYQTHADSYINPHQSRVIKLLSRLTIQPTSIADIACGNGIITKHLNVPAYGVDPYMQVQYTNETGNMCLNLTFKQMTYTLLPPADAAVISYAIDLIDDEQLAMLIFQWARQFNYIITIRPNKHSIVSPYITKISHDIENQTQLIVYKSNVIHLI